MKGNIDSQSYSRDDPMSQQQQQVGKGHSWVLARRWIQECLQDHSGCHLSTVRQCTAKRLIQIGTLEDFSDVRLVERTPEGWKNNDLRYVTLSHRWGGSLSFKLTEDRLRHFFNLIPFNQLPRTFQDAIVAARSLPEELNVRYIWIDAICIIQDQLSKEDWETEAPKMADIYKHSSLTFAAHFGVAASIAVPVYFGVGNPYLSNPFSFDRNGNRKTRRTYAVIKVLSRQSSRCQI